jgi:predicted transcriptional regulator
MNKARQEPVQLSTEFVAELRNLADSTGRNMKWIVEDALADKYPIFNKLKGKK